MSLSSPAPTVEPPTGTIRGRRRHESRPRALTAKGTAPLLRDGMVAKPFEGITSTADGPFNTHWIYKRSATRSIRFSPGTRKNESRTSDDTSHKFRLHRAAPRLRPIRRFGQHTSTRCRLTNHPRKKPLRCTSTKISGAVGLRLARADTVQRRGLRRAGGQREMLLVEVIIRERSRKARADEAQGFVSLGASLKGARAQSSHPREHPKRQTA